MKISDMYVLFGIELLDLIYTAIYCIREYKKYKNI